MRTRRRTAVSPSLSLSLLLCVLLPLRVGRAQQAAEQAGPVAPETGVIAGVVTAQETGLALPEVRVSVLGTSLAATADHDGRFTIAQVPPGTYRLQARLIGYEVGEIPGVVVAAGQTATTNLRLHSLPVALQEVVVVGYGTQVRRDVTSSQSSVAAADLNTTPTVNTVDALQGRAAGVDIVNTGQKPGDGVRVRVRGARSITAGNDPLYVVDGIPAAGVTDLSPNDIASIEILKDASATAIYGSRGANGVVLIATYDPLYVVDGIPAAGVTDLSPNDIASIEILKDASATAIYGSRGAHGVVLITTRQGSAGPTTFTYDSYVGVQGERSRVPMMNGQQFAQLKRDANRTVGHYHCDVGVAACDSGDAQLFLPVELASIQPGRSTNWP